MQRFIDAGGASATGPLAVVLVPTRELAMQVAEAVHRYGKALRVRVLPVYGGQPIGRQIHAMRSGVDVVIAHPAGRSTTCGAERSRWAA
jgi:ATP-dependent RNA helicase DeaD